MTAHESDPIPIHGRGIMTERRIVCGWCPMQLPDNHDDWYLHFLVEHGRAGFSVRMYEAKTIEEEAAEL